MCLWNTPGKYFSWIEVREGKEIITGEVNKQGNMHSKLLQSVTD